MSGTIYDNKGKNSLSTSIKKAYQQLVPIYGKGEAAAVCQLIKEYFTDNISENKFADNYCKKLELFVNELVAKKPIQYILEKAWFWNLPFYVNENVLIPRPETEELVHWLLEIAKEKIKNTTKELTVLDIGTGSGCMAISIKKELPFAKITALDISNAALEVAQKNAKLFHAEISFLQCNFLQQSSTRNLSQYDVIVSNPPYIPSAEKDTMEKNVTDWEPSTALFVPDDDPLIFYREIAIFGEIHLKQNGCIFLECHQNLAEQTILLMQQYGYATELRIDIFENDRMIKAWKP